MYKNKFNGSVQFFQTISTLRFSFFKPFQHFDSVNMVNRTMPTPTHNHLPFSSRNKPPQANFDHPLNFPSQFNFYIHSLSENFKALIFSSLFLLTCTKFLTFCVAGNVSLPSKYHSKVNTNV